jgi:hypothetical protein
VSEKEVNKEMEVELLYGIHALLVLSGQSNADDWPRLGLYLAPIL